MMRPIWGAGVRGDNQGGRGLTAGRRRAHVRSMLPLLALLAQTAGPLPAPTRTLPPAPATLASYFSNADYPREAIKRREQGLVVFRIEIDPAGRVSRCEVTRSSGSPALDRTTCRVARERLRFKPATDEAGRPTADRMENLKLVWRLPG